MNHHLVSLLKANMGAMLDPNLAADIMLAADQLPTLVYPERIERIQPEQYGEFTFAVEKMEDIQNEVRPLHRAHWLEIGRNPLVLQPDYATFQKYEHAGRFILFTLRKEGKLLGQCSMYLEKSTHTGALISTEDAIYLMPKARRGRTAMWFVRYIEESLYRLGAREIEVSVKTTNKAAKFFEYLGYRQTDVGLKKVME